MKYLMRALILLNCLAVETCETFGLLNVQKITFDQRGRVSWSTYPVCLSINWTFLFPVNKFSWNYSFLRVQAKVGDIQVFYCVRGTIHSFLRYITASYLGSCNHYKMNVIFVIWKKTNKKFRPYFRKEHQRNVRRTGVSKTRFEFQTICWV